MLGALQAWQTLYRGSILPKRRRGYRFGGSRCPRTQLVPAGSALGRNAGSWVFRIRPNSPWAQSSLPRLEELDRFHSCTFRSTSVWFPTYSARRSRRTAVGLGSASVARGFEAGLVPRLVRTKLICIAALGAMAAPFLSIGPHG